MNILIITQKVDKNDPILGFFHEWIRRLAPSFNKLSVICLEKGTYDLPENVKVYSLGKENGINKIKYISKFFGYIFGLAREYDTVFVHMNQEYILLGGWFWRLTRKQIVLWRNHAYGSIFTRIAVLLSNKVLCTSKYSYTARFGKTEIMPVGIDTQKFSISNFKFSNKETKNKILFLGRMAPIKKPDLLVEALKILKDKNTEFSCDFYGDALPNDSKYFEELKNKVEKYNLAERVKFYGAIPNYEIPDIYKDYNIFINLTPSGSFDKTILEAASCGSLVLLTNKSLLGDIDERLISNETPEDIARGIDLLLNINVEERSKISESLQEYVLKNHSLDALMNKLQWSITRR